MDPICYYLKLFLTLVNKSYVSYKTNISGPTKDMLNGINQLMTGSSEPYDPEFYNRLVECLNTVDQLRLLKVVDAQWKGFLDNSATLGTKADPWKTCSEKVDPENSVRKM